jgi:shikimate dehydrogenase
MPDKYAVIGNPVEHSLSPAIHAAFARATRQDISYGKIHAPADGFKAAALRFRDEGGKGLNVTLPFKHEAWNLVGAHSADATGAEAVNTIEFLEDKMVGHNTDGVGLVCDLKDNLRCPIKDQRVLLMGAGGAAYGVMERLLHEQPQKVVIANRTLEKAQSLVGHFETRPGLPIHKLTGCSYEDLHSERFDLVINATSAGLTNEMPPLPPDIFARNALAYDMVYGKVTPFLSFAQDRAARVSDGLGMLVAQAAESFFIWRGVRPETAPVIEALRAEGRGQRAEGKKP